MLKADVVEFVGFREHDCRDGRRVTLTLLRRACKECGAEFEFAQPVGGRVAVNIKKCAARCRACRPNRSACTHPGAQRHTDGSLTCLMCRAPVALRGGADEPWRLETRYPTNLDTPAPARAEGLAVSP